MDTQTFQQFPAAVRVYETLQARIAEGVYRPGAWMPPERDLAGELQVSRPVVRAALARLVEDGLIVREPGCRPRVNGLPPAARKHRGTGRRSAALHTRVRSIAVVLPQQPGYASAQAILRGVSSALRRHAQPFHLAVFDTHHAEALPGEPAGAVHEADVLDRMAREGVGGVILWHLTGQEAMPALRRLCEAHIPVVYIDRYPEGIACDYVGVDNRTAVKEGVEYLAGLGHRRIAYATNSERITTVRERLEGYLEGLHAVGIAPSEELLYTTPEEMRTDLGPAADHLLTLQDPPTAVMALNDLHAFAFIREVQARGKRVPEDICVVGFDDIEAYSPHPPILTTIRQPFYQIGSRGADLLLRRLASPDGGTESPRQHVLLPASLVARSTCRPAAPCGT